MIIKKLFCILFLSLTVTSLSRGDIQYQVDPQRSGIFETEFDLSNLKVIWRSEKVNSGNHTASKSSPIVDSTGIYIGSDQGFFYCFDFDGKIKWKKKITNAAQGIHATTAVDEKNLYIGSYDGFLHAMNKITGETIWKKKLGDAIGSSVLLLDNEIYTSVEMNSPKSGYIYKLSKIDGKVFWKSLKLADHPHSSISINKLKTKLFVGDNSGAVTAFDKNDGKVLWQLKTNGEIKSSPLVLDNKIYLTNWDSQFLEISADDGVVLRKVKLKSKSQSTATYDPTTDMFIINSFAPDWIYGIKKTNMKIQWTKNAYKGRFIASGIVVKSKSKKSSVWIACEHKSICEYDTATGKEKQIHELASRVSGSAFIFKNTVYISENSGSLVVLGKEK